MFHLVAKLRYFHVFSLITNIININEYASRIIYIERLGKSDVS